MAESALCQFPSSSAQLTALEQGLSVDELTRDAEDLTETAEKPPPPIRQDIVVHDVETWFKIRYLVATLCFWSFVVNYAMRININIAIVEMVNPMQAPDAVQINVPSFHDGDLLDVESDQRNNNSFSGTNFTFVEADACGRIIEPIGNLTVTHDPNKFDWDEQTQSLVLGSVFFGYITTQFLGGRVGELIGAKRVLGYPLFCAALLTLLTPLAAKMYGYGAVIGVRVLIGMAEGVSYPAAHALLSHWAPPLERSKMSSIIYTGAQVGTIGTLAPAGILMSAWGWEAMFYFFGLITFIWFVLWMVLVDDTPSQHWLISSQEKEYILNSLSKERKQGKQDPLPWKNILTSVPFWALLVAHMGNNFGKWVMLAQLPTYMKNILHFEIQAVKLIGAKRVLGYPLFCAALLTLLTPLAAKMYGYGAVIGVRVLIGMAEGVSYPAAHALLSHWAPPLERSKMSSIIYTGAQVGTIGTLAPAGILMSAWGWEAMFYFFGLITFIWFVLWMVLVDDTPSQHWLISSQEKEFILNTMPYVAMFVSAQVYGSYVDSLRTRGIVSTTMVRKVSNFIAQAGSGLCFVAVAYTGCDSLLSVAFFCLGEFFQGAVYSGYMANHLDLAPNFADALFGEPQILHRLIAYRNVSIVAPLLHSVDDYVNFEPKGDPKVIPKMLSGEVTGIWDVAEASSCFLFDSSVETLEAMEHMLYVTRSKNHFGYKIGVRDKEESSLDVIFSAAVFEDDIHFEYNFLEYLRNILDDASQRNISWDLLYMGYEAVLPMNHSKLNGSIHFARPDYTYGSYAYIITLEGARKLVNSPILRKVIPTDEFLPVMYNSHPIEALASKFPQRDLKALVIWPSLIWEKWLHRGGRKLGRTSDTGVQATSSSQIYSPTPQ
ncbi:unnamed protein product [Notodromas monacha]|uniref:Major facilitator superfamily (MFS) profile domain-containing protein n=1 Tax=Notodromas monacha TaxID=399045 RepID=A0A7R9BN65_9CRUS|nr:unnamed protein product [Notodromas monacha]CAG0917729.1 unnamed protein product [Notodromas monacha]